MKRFIGVLLMLSFILLLAGCASTEQPKKITPVASNKMIKEAPKWFLSPPTKKGYLFAPGTATSRDMQMAKDKASHTARLELARGLETHMTALTKRFQEEVGTDTEAQYLDQFTQATKEVVDVTLNGVTQEDLEMVNESGVFRCYALLKLDLNSANQQLLNKIKQQEALLTRMRSTQVFQELEQSVPVEEPAMEEQLPMEEKQPTEE
ncbi:MAG: hypothetical protein V2A56_04420 [bacterium]